MDYLCEMCFFNIIYVFYCISIPYCTTNPLFNCAFTILIKMEILELFHIDPKTFFIFKFSCFSQGNTEQYTNMALILFGIACNAS